MTRENNRKIKWRQAFSNTTYFGFSCNYELWPDGLWPWRI